MFCNQLLKITLMYMVFALLGCGIEATLMSEKGATLAVQKVDNSGVINDTNQNSFLMQGICKDISEIVISTDSFSVNTPCIDNAWSINLDLSALSGQTITVQLVGVSKEGVKDASTSVKLTKKLSCTFDSQIIPDGQSVVAYTSATVLAGDTCASVSESRLCSNGVLSGSASFSSCSAGADSAALVTVEEFEERVSETVGAKSFTLKLSEAKPYAVSVNYYVSGDYVYMLDADLNPAGSVTFAPNETAKTLSFQVLNNGVGQIERLIQLNLVGTNRPMVSLGEHYQARLFLRDDDGGFNPSIDKAFVIGSQITCALWMDGSLFCAGAQFGSMPAEVDGGVKYTKLEDSQQGNGDNQSFCGLTTTKKIKCNNGLDQAMTIVDGATNYLDFDSEYGLCGVTDTNELKCEVSGSMQVVDAGVSYKKVVKSYSKICGLTTGNLLRCASVSYGPPSAFEDVDAGVQYSDLSSSGQGDTYGLSPTGEWKLICGYGGCTPTILDAGNTYTGLHRQCAIKANGSAKCDNSSVELNYNFKHIYTTGSGGNYQRACGVTVTGEMLCWNTSDYYWGGWKGVDVIASSTVRTEMQGLTNVAKIRRNIGGATCAIQTSGQVKCFDGTVQGFYRSTPVDQMDLANHNIKDIFNIWYVMNSDGYVFSGIMGSYVQTDTEKYTAFSSAGGWSYEFCGFTQDQKIRCKKGDGTFEYLYSGAAIKDYTGSDSQGCYLSPAGVLSCWDNYYNSLPNPTVVDNTDTYTQISGHYQRGCGISATSGEIKCWDNNWNYAADPVVFTVQDPGVQYAKVLAPQNGYWDNEVCGITTNGVLKCGTRNGAYTIVDSGTLYSEIVSASCGVTTDGKYRCSGGYAAGAVSLNWKRPVLMNKWFTNIVVSP
ncbi:hypothetical protein [Bdellovibrio bacteriovorus]|uniref:hypothetical protein n=1 Tax=Bdellovibrio TaxID=958 RepID=UPI0035A81E72